MDEYEHGIEPRVRTYLKKVLNSLFMGLFWMLLMMFFGLFLGWAIPFGGKVDQLNIIFYCLFVLTLGWLLWYYYRVWRNG